MIAFKGQEDLFKLIGSELKERTECIVIGGSAMMYYNAKEGTKDIDLVFMEKKAFDDVKNALKNLEFIERKSVIKIFKHYELLKKEKRKPVFMGGRNTRIDLFLKEVICFEISETILNRITEMHEYNNLIVKIIAPEDIILLKCATEREKDRIDAFELIKKFNIKWDTVIKESINQTKEGKAIYPVFLYDFLLELKEDLKADIPGYVIREIMKIGEKEMIKRLKKK